MPASKTEHTKTLEVGVYSANMQTRILVALGNGLLLPRSTCYSGGSQSSKARSVLSVTITVLIVGVIVVMVMLTMLTMMVRRRMKSLETVIHMYLEP